MTDWREEALKKAAEKYGRPFKCAGQNMLRQVWHKGAWLAVAPGQDVREQAQEPVIFLTERSKQ